MSLHLQLRDAIGASVSLIDDSALLAACESGSVDAILATLDPCFAHMRQTMDDPLAETLERTVVASMKREATVRAAASSLGIPFKGGTPEYRKAYNELKKKGKLGTAAPKAPVAETNPDPTPSPSPSPKPAAPDAPKASGKDPFEDKAKEWNMSPEQTAMMYYQGSGYANVNAVLRKEGDPELQKDIWKETVNTSAHATRHLDGAIAAATPLASPATVFRGISPDVFKKIAKQAPGTVFQDKAFVSTSTEKKAAKFQYSQLHITLPAGSKVLDFNAALGEKSQFKNEKEWLLPRGSAFRVTGKSKNTLHVELVL